MKKITIMLIVLVLASGTVMAQIDRFLGVVAVIDDFEYTSETMLIRPFFGYEKENEKSDIYFEAGIPFGLKDPLAESFWLGIDLNLKVLFSNDVSDTSQFSFWAESWVNWPLISDSGYRGYNASFMVNYLNPLGASMFQGNLFTLVSFNSNTWLGLGAELNKTTDFGSIYAQVELPFILSANYGLVYYPVLIRASAFDIAGLNFTLGMETENGLGFGATLFGLLKMFDANIDFQQQLDLFASYTNESLFAKLTLSLPVMENGIDSIGLLVTPEFEYNLSSDVAIFGALPISCIGAADESLYVGLSIGLKFNF